MGPPTGIWPPRAHQRAPGEPNQLSPPPSRDVIRITFAGSSVRSSSIPLSLHQQAVPDFVTDMLLEGNVANVIGDGGDQSGGALAPCCLTSPKPSPLVCS